MSSALPSFPSSKWTSSTEVASSSQLPSFALSIPRRWESSHEKPTGPGDQRPTARQVLDQFGLLASKSTSTHHDRTDGLRDAPLSHLTIIITGGNSGLGLETAQALYETGAQIYITVRDQKKGEEAVTSILGKTSYRSPHEIQILEMSLDDFSSIRSAAKQFLSKSNRLNVLINNAGIMACPQGKTKDGFELQFGTNHLGHFLLFQLLRDVLLSSSSHQFQSRVISLSSMGHRMSDVHLDDLNLLNGYQEWVAYGQSKTANILFANELERRYGSKGLHGISVHPGGIMTNLARHLSDDVTKAWEENESLRRSFKNAEQGAATTVLAAVTSDFEGKGGVYLEECAVALPLAGTNPADVNAKGFAAHAYNQQTEQKLWEESERLVATVPGK